MERVLDFHHYFLRLLVKVTTFIRSHSYVTVMSDRAVEGNCHLGENGTSFPTIIPKFSIPNSIYSRHLKIFKYLSIKRMNRNCHFRIEEIKVHSVWLKIHSRHGLFFHDLNFMWNILLIFLPFMWVGEGVLFLTLISLCA